MEDLTIDKTSPHWVDMNESKENYDDYHLCENDMFEYDLTEDEKLKIAYLCWYDTESCMIVADEYINGNHNTIEEVFQMVIDNNFLPAWNSSMSEYQNSLDGLIEYNKNNI